MVASKLTKNLGAFASDAQDRSTFVLDISPAFQKSFALGTVDEFYSAVVSQRQSLGGVRNRHCRILGCSSHLEKKLMLLRLQSCF